ncbi:MAG: transglycosylase domain-containing protein [Alphaproteobacteria bacterium]
MSDRDDRPAPPPEYYRENEPPGGKPPGGGGSERRRRRGFKGWLLTLLGAGAVLFLIAAAGGGVFIGYKVASLPAYEDLLETPHKTQVTLKDRHGKVIAVRGLAHGDTVKVEELPPYVPRAVMAVEDRRFYHHPGIDPFGLARALLTNVRAGHVVAGGSTITQQLAKNLFLSNDRTLRRKVQELFLALALEVKFTKDQILNLYLNRVYFGAGTYGLDAAAQRYFGKPAKELELGEAAMLAGLLKAPTHYAPTADIERAETRARIVLDAMVESGYATQEERELAEEARPTIAKSAATPGSGYFVDWSLDALFEHVGRSHPRLIVETTLDLRLQRAAEKVINADIEKYGEKWGFTQGALVCIDGTGAVRALVGGKSYENNQFNRAVAAKRQPGSSFKTFVYLAAVEKGYSRRSRWEDVPITIEDWSPENYTEEFEGTVSMQQAFAKSINTVAVQVSEAVGRDRVINLARRLGITADLKARPSLALGAFEVTPLEMATAYVPFANGGEAVLPHAVIAVRDGDGNLLFERQGSGLGQVIRPRDLAVMNRMMANNVENGTGQSARLKGRQAGGKTGTSTDYRDAWFVGYTADYITAVWLGNDDNSPTKEASGGSVPAWAWRHFMTAAHANLPPRPLPPDDDTLWAEEEERDDGVGGFLRGIFGSRDDRRRDRRYRDRRDRRHDGRRYRDRRYDGRQ